MMIVMIDLFFLSFLLLIGLTLLVLGVWRWRSEFFIFSSLFFILMGMSVINGVSYVSGTFENVTSNSTIVIVNSYEVYSGIIPTGIGWFLSFFGLGVLFLAGYVIWENSRKGDYELEDEDGNN